jgi:putative PIN family toxin of toxin-antitoxin system
VAGSTRQRVVLDTNVWISAWLTSLGAPTEVVRRSLLDAEVVFTAASFDELQTRLWRPKFDRYLSMEHRRRLLQDTAAIAWWAEVPADLAHQSFCRDADDDRIVHAAIAGGARWLVSGDKDLLEVADVIAKSGLTVVTPADALRAPDFCGAR